jgi:hypothetical protein
MYLQEIMALRQRFGLGDIAFDWATADWNSAEAWAIAGGTGWPMGIPLWVYDAQRAWAAQYVPPTKSQITATAWSMKTVWSGGASKFAPLGAPELLDYNYLVKGQPENLWTALAGLAKIIPPKAPADPVAAFSRLCQIINALDANPDMTIGGMPTIVYIENRMDGIERADAESDLIGRPWGYDKAAQQAKRQEALDALALVMSAVDHGTAEAGIAALTAAKARAREIPYPKSASDLLELPAWQQIGKGVAQAAAAFVAMVVNPLAAPLVMASAAVTAQKEAKAEKAFEKSVDQATEDLMALKATQAALEQVAAGANPDQAAATAASAVVDGKIPIVADTYVLMVEGARAGMFDNLEIAASATIKLTTPGDRFEVLCNGTSLGIRIRTSTGSVAVPDDVGTNIYSVPRENMTQLVTQAEKETAAPPAPSAGGLPWWLLPAAGAAAVASQVL